MAPTRGTFVGDFEDKVGDAIVRLSQRRPPGAQACGLVVAVLFMHPQTGASEWAVSGASIPELAGPLDQLFPRAAKAILTAAGNAPERH
jgi:hypothetical protein